MRIGIDIVSTMKIVNKMAVYTGGTNYVKSILKAIKEKNDCPDVKILIIVPTGFVPKEEDKELFSDERFEFIYTDSLLSYDYQKVDIMFLPQVNGLTLREIPKIKQKNPSMKIYATLHDRQHNFYRFDWYDRYYYEGLKRTGIPMLLEYFLKKVVFTYEYGRCVSYIDKIFTVSNHSMQELMHQNVANIKYFIQNDIVQRYKPLKTSMAKYILFVGGGRPEKNLLRTLEAFCTYKNKNAADIKMIITGVSDNLVDSFIQSGKIDKKLIETEVKFLSYVSYQELAELYAGCRYTVFTSKGEGYGLPVREAMGFGKTILASRTTSVPEVAGAALYYVDPFDVESIYRGFEYLGDDANLKRYENYIARRNEIVKMVSEQDTQIFMDELLNA